MLKIDFIKAAVSLTLFSFVFPYFRRETRQPVWKFSEVDRIKRLAPFSKPSSPRFWRLLAFLFFALAFLQPEWTAFVQEKSEKEGKALFLLIDRSGSMREPLYSQTGTTKFQAAKKVTGEILNELAPSDWAGLATFSRGVQWLSPLTQDKAFIEERLASLEPPLENSETDNGTSLGHALAVTSELLARLSDSRSIQASLFMITDGFQSPNPADLYTLRGIDPEIALKEARAKGIRLYLVNIDPRFATEELAPARRRLEELAKSTRGAFFLANDADSLSRMKEQILDLETSRFPSSGWKEVPEVSLSPLLIVLGMTFLAFAIFHETVLYRRIP